MVVNRTTQCIVNQLWMEENESFTFLPFSNHVTSGVGLAEPEVQFTFNQSPTVYSGFLNVIRGFSI